MNYTLRIADKKDSVFLAKARIDFLGLLGYEISQEEYKNVLNLLIKQIKEKINKTLVCVLAEYNNQVIGTAYMTIEERLYHPETPNGIQANIVNVYTKESFRGQGIASAMVKKLMECSKDYNIEKLTLDATKMGESVYRGLGFSSEKDPILPTPMYFYTNK